METWDGLPSLVVVTFSCVDVVDYTDDVVVFVVVLSQKPSIKSLVKIGTVRDVAFVVLVIVVVVDVVVVVIVVVDLTNLPLKFG